MALYGEGTDWADEIAGRNGADTQTDTVVDAAFSLYAREALDYSGGRTHFRKRS